jgi:predicted glycosyltransferase
MARYLFASHDGFGLGHVRRNTLVARAILAREPEAEIVVVTGLPMRPAWLGQGVRVVPVPALLKDSAGAYRNPGMSVQQALAARSAAFRAAVDEVRPHVVVVDRHPYGTAGELKDGLHAAKRAGAALVLGLRDILDQSAAVEAELAGAGWAGVPELFDEVLVYGERILCDHQREYGLPVAPRYTGWVADSSGPRTREPGLIVVSAGGGGDGAQVFDLGTELAHRMPEARFVVVAGPYATRDVTAAGNLTVLRDAPGCAELFARATGVVQMAGYNTTFEALAAGLRPVLVPRRNPRREQAIRASRLTALGMADTVDEGVPAEEVDWLLGRDRLLSPGALAAAGIRLDGAERAAALVTELARSTRVDRAPFAAARTEEQVQGDTVGSAP